MKQNQKKPPKLWITCLFLCMVICFDVIAIFTPDRKFSETENRMLAAFPSFSTQGLSDGSTGENVEKYLSDQFAFRDVWAGISFFTRSKLMGQNEMNGVYLGKDVYLMLVPSEPQPDSDQVIRFPQLELNLANYQVKACGQVIPFTPKEVEILHMLTASAGQVFSREQILSHVWGYDFFGDTRTVDTHIKRIRQKLPQEGVPWSLKTVYGVGYKFEVAQ